MEISDADERKAASLALLQTRPEAIRIPFEELRSMLNPDFFREADAIAMACASCMMKNCMELGRDIVLDIGVDRPVRYQWLLNEAKMAGAKIVKKSK